MLTQVWTAKHVPSLIPDFVDPHITVEDDGSFIFEVNPSHETFKNSKDVKKAVRTFLRAGGFTGINLIYEGDKPDNLHPAST